MYKVINENKPSFYVLPSHTSESEIWKKDSLSPEMRNDSYHILIFLRFADRASQYNLSN